jgi:hypothetical protein
VKMMPASDPGGVFERACRCEDIAPPVFGLHVRVFARER